MYQNIIGSSTAWAVLVSGGGLLAMPVMNTGLVLTVLVWMWRTKRAFLKNLFSFKSVAGFGINWKVEIWPFQWKVALSWLSGYFIFQLFTPVLFAYHGAAEAGKMGVSFSIANALMGIAMAWMNTQAPKFGTLISRRDYCNLDHIFVVTLTRSLAVLALLAMIFCVVDYFAHFKNIQYSNRLLDPLPFALLMLATTLNYVTFAQSAYLRAHKQEPFLAISLISAGLIAVLTITLGREYGALGIMSGYLAVCALVGFGWGSAIFVSKRREWQDSCALDVVIKV